MSDPRASRPSQRVGSSLWLGDVRRLLRTNLLARSGRVWLVTITAPGNDLLPWDGDRVDGECARRWNRTAQRRWSELHRRAGQHARRHGHGSPLIAGVWQLQRRGVLHRHVVLAYETPAERAAARLYVAHVRAHARRWGFGYVDARDRGNGSTVMAATAASRYLTADLTDERGQLLQAAERRDRPRRLVYVRAELLAATSCTMRRLRRVRQLWAYVERQAASFTWMNDPAECMRVSFLLSGTVPARGP